MSKKLKINIKIKIKITLVFEKKINVKFDGKKIRIGCKIDVIIRVIEGLIERYERRKNINICL